MAETISFRMLTGPFNTFLADRERRMNRASMWAVREAGRRARKAAAAQAPVLQDKSAPTVRQVKRGHATTDKPVAGLLKASIKASKAMKLEPGTASIKVGPRGPRVHLYAEKQEKRYGYMAAGEQAAQAELQAIAMEAFERVWRA